MNKRSKTRSADRSSNGDDPDQRKTSDEYDRFESFVKRIVRVPKKEIDAARKREAAKKRT